MTEAPTCEIEWFDERVACWATPTRVSAGCV